MSQESDPMPAPPAVVAGARVLVVEGDATARRVLARLLTLQGYAVRQAGTAASAVAHLRAPGGCAAVILDVNLPDAPGTTLLRQIRTEQPNVPVLLLTGAPDHFVEEARQLGVDQVMRKPADVPQLLEWLGGSGGG
jgi:two-component system cell cycle sensor histidine kinase/response regulator CckA